MAGHSKWAQIKRGKAVTDAAKSRIFSRFARLITLESKKAGGSVTSPSLAAVITRAKAANMPKENIERAITKGASKDAGELELASPGAALWAFTKTPDGSLAPNEPLMEVAGDDEVKLGELLSALDEHDDVQAVYTNARGYESTGD
jgi:transcriptional/translational regulatory protein YebC/TACO1